MYIQPTFADADAEYEESDFVIFGAPFDGTSSFRTGSRFAPDALRQASYNFETYSPELDIDITDIKVCDIGNLDMGCLVEDCINRVWTQTKQILKDGKIPIMMGGEHSLSIGCVGACTDIFEDVGVIVLDAHLDMRESYEGLDKGHASTSYQILKLIPPNRYSVVGVRSGSREEFEFVRSAGIKFVTSFKIKNEGVEQALGEIFDGLKDAGCKHLYISIDADVVDPAYAPGVGNPEPFGLSPWDVEYIIKKTRKMAVGLDVVELIPHYDFSQGAILFSKLIREFIAYAYVARGF